MRTRLFQDLSWDRFAGGRFRDDRVDEKSRHGSFRVKEFEI